MSDDPLTYLLDRFATDAVTLRARAAHLAGAAAPAHGPDAAASLRMAEACELVIAMLNDLSTETDDEMLDALDGLGPELHALSERADDAFVRSVYGGAATRVSEIVRRTRGDEGEGEGDDDVDDDDLQDELHDEVELFDDVVDDDVRLG